MAGIDPISNIASLANTILSRVLPDKAAQNEAKAKILEMQVSGEIAATMQELQSNAAATAAQTTTDNTEAGSSNLFVSGWRPFIGWICGAALGYNFIFRPLLTYTTLCFGGHFTAPPLEMASLNQLLFGMLGLATMRTVEKVQGINAGE